VFSAGNSSDYIYDFRQVDGDRIDVSACGFHSLADMTITADAMPETPRLPLPANDSVTLVGISNPSVLHRISSSVD